MTDRDVADGLFAADAERSDGDAFSGPPRGAHRAGTTMRSSARRGKPPKGDARSVHIAGMDDDTETFSVRKFLAFLGPGFLMCIGYVDPGT